ncbi:MFS transporter [Actinoplanes sp. URMC 104]|uniref:MFS transporter n=1 Tax=Actinoplanes sp. URMC 104 TaxID=3423409 RepID=UPI003F196C34
MIANTRGAAWSVWAGGLLIYVVGVFQRFTLSVAAVDALDRLGISAAGLSALAVVQVAVYAAIQIPVGVLADRFGYRRLILAGGLLMAVGQTAVALAHSLPLAVGGRLVVGLGDGLMWICMARIVAGWFPARRNPLMLQVTAMVGQLGAIASAVPMVFLLRSGGWTTAFLVSAGVGIASVLLGLALLREPPDRAALPPASVRELAATLRWTYAETGTRLGLWTHFGTQFPAMAFALLWGFPFLTITQDLDATTAGTLLSILTLSFIVGGPILGHLVGRHPLSRSRMALTVIGSSAAVWTVVLLWPGRAPLGLLVVLVVVLGWNQPGSMIGFDHARSFNPGHRLSTATGIVNVGGHVASLVCILLIGLVSTALPHAGLSGDDALRWAFAVQYPLWIVGAWQILRYRGRARRTYGRYTARLRYGA